MTRLLGAIVDALVTKRTVDYTAVCNVLEDRIRMAREKIGVKWTAGLLGKCTKQPAVWAKNILRICSNDVTLLVDSPGLHVIAILKRASQRIAELRLRSRPRSVDRDESTVSIPREALA